jgi:uncharacterized protein YdaU (DUF1376 family)
MHYYPFNIGDYKSHTSHLDLMENLAYRLLLDLYYLHERPLSACTTTVARQIGMREHEEKVQSVLQEFFVLGETGWSNIRADREIKQFHGKKEQASRAGKASAERKSNGRSTDVQREFNGRSTESQRTFNQTETETETETKTETKKKQSKVNTPPNVSDETWSSFVAQRKLAKATLTQTVVNSIQREADKAGWSLEQALSETVIRGWRSFKADWVKDKPVAQQLKSFKQMDEERSKERYNLMVGRSTSRVIDITPDNFLEIN